MQKKEIYGVEFKIDIEEFINKAQAFHKDKKRAEQLQKKESYLDSLCPNIIDKICFKAVYDELFPEDTLTSKLLMKKIIELLNSNSEEDINFFNVRTLDDVDMLYKKYRIFAKTAIKRLQQIELMQIERMRKNMLRQEQKDIMAKHYQKSRRNDLIMRSNNLRSTDKPHILDSKSNELKKNNNIAKVARLSEHKADKLMGYDAFAKMIEKRKKEALLRNKNLRQNRQDKTLENDKDKSVEGKGQSEFQNKELLENLLLDRKKRMDREIHRKNNVHSNRQMQRYEQRLKQMELKKENLPAQLSK